MIEDMTSGRPMDRLVCGDVGFGKPKSAARRILWRQWPGRQVAVLVPTTLLAEQHYQNFRDRFADWPVRIAELSFPLHQKVNEALKGSASGGIDIVIGTTSWRSRM